MEIPVYVTIQEVQRVCLALHIRDWTALSEARVLPEEARAILGEIDTDGLKIDPRPSGVDLKSNSSTEYGIRVRT